MTKEALKLALEALEEAADAIDSWGSYASGYFQVKHDLEGDISKAKSAITAIKEALSSCQCPECKVLLHASDCAVHNEPAYPKGECNCGAQPEQEPVFWYSAQEDEFMPHKIRKEHERRNSFTHKVGRFDLALYTTPPQRTWIGLTEAQCGVLWKTNMTPFEYYQAIEAKLKEKNT